MKTILIALALFLARCSGGCVLDPYEPPPLTPDSGIINIRVGLCCDDADAGTQ